MSGPEPERWLDSEGLPEALRTDLARAAGHDVGYDVAAGAARFEATLAQGPLPPDGGGGGGAASGGGAAAGGGAKSLALVAGLVAVVGGGAIAWSVAGGEPEPASAPVATVQRDARPEPHNPAGPESAEKVDEAPSVTSPPAADTTPAPSVPEPPAAETPREAKRARGGAASKPRPAPETGLAMIRAESS